MEDSPKKRSFSKSRKDSPAKSSRSRRTSDNETSKRKRTDNKPYQRKEYDERPPLIDSVDRPPRREYGDRPPRRDADDRPRRKDFEEKPQRKRRNITAESPILTEIVEKRIREGRQAPKKQKILSLEYEEQYGPIRLNKYISNAGICSRRDADNLIISGAITVNGKVVSELGTKVMPTDEIRFGDKVLQREKPVYLLLNKPKDYITTTDDEFDRKDVMELVRGACKERIYPVGRLDKNTTGLLLFTNDGEMTKKLTHPKHLVLKTYHVELNKNMTGSDFETLLNGIELDDGIIKPDELAYVNDSKNELGITIHSGKNRIVRRIFESLGYDVIKLDRVVFAGLTKKNLPRGKWRFLSEAETNYLKMI